MSLDNAFALLIEGHPNPSARIVSGLPAFVLIERHPRAEVLPPAVLSFGEAQPSYDLVHRLWSQLRRA